MYFSLPLLVLEKCWIALEWFNNFWIKEISSFSKQFLPCNLLTGTFFAVCERRVRQQFLKEISFQLCDLTDSLSNNDHQRMMVDPMFMIVLNSREFPQLFPQLQSNQLWSFSEFYKYPVNSGVYSIGILQMTIIVSLRYTCVLVYLYNCMLTTELHFI